MLVTALPSQIIAKFGTAWCKPCKAIAPYFKEIESKFTDIVFLDVDHDENDNEDLTDEWGVAKFPTFVVIKDGEAVERMQNSNKEMLYALVDKYFQSVAASAFTMEAEF